MNKKLKTLFFFLIFILFANCSFDSKTGIWNEDQKEEKRDGDPLEKLEYVGYKLEKGYNEKKATFYLFDYQGIGNT